MTNDTDARLMALAPRCVFNGMRRASRVIAGIYEAAFAHTALTPAQCPLLMVLHFAGPQTIGELAGRMLLDRTTLTRNVRPLLERGFVQIAPGADRRERAVRITADGDAALAAALPHWEAAQRQIELLLGATATQQLLAELHAAARHAENTTE